MERYSRISMIAAVGFVLVAAGPRAAAQDQGQSAPAIQSNNASKWTIGKVSFTGYLDAYYSLNFNHPATDVNQQHNFDLTANEPALAFAKMSLDYAPSPVGFHFDIGGGDAVTWINSTDPLQNNLMNHMLQAYASVKVDKWHGVQFDFGKFYTSAGAELTEAYTNYNYTRSILYANGPYYHFGLRTTIPVNDKVSVGFQVVNGWNDVKDNNGGKTFGLTGSAKLSKKVTLADTFYAGPEKPHSNYGWRKYNDTVLSVSADDKNSFYLNFDYGSEKLLPPGPTATFYSLAGAVQHKLTDKWALAGRSEFYTDAEGLITGTSQTLKEVTGTLQYKPHPNFMSFLEYRYDWSNQPYFDRGNEPGSAKGMNTVAIGLVVYLGPEL